MATSPLFGWEEPDDTDLVKDGAAAIRTLGNAIDTSMGDLLGGTTGQVLSKNSNTNMDFTWVTSDDANAIQNTIVDAKGDLIAASASDTPARLAVGTNGLVLEAASGETTGLKWGFKGIVQIIQSTTTASANNSTNVYADTGLSATITPKSASNRVYVMVTQPTSKQAGDAQSGCFLNLVRTSTQLAQVNYNGYSGTSSTIVGLTSINYLDSPATTSATTYKTQFKNNANAASVGVNEGIATITLIEVSV